MKKPELINKIENCFFSFELWGVKRETPNEFTELGEAVDEFKMAWKKEMFKLFRIPQIVEWLSKNIPDIPLLNWIETRHFKNAFWLITGVGIFILFICGIISYIIQLR